jgi:hypothetical protein
VNKITCGLDRRALLSRLRAFLIHVGLSLIVAMTAAGLVFVLWYPTPFREISGGRELFLLVIAIDVVIGPLITFAVFDRRKPRSELVRDLAVVALLQLSALGYGLYSVAQARPAVVALEGSRLRVVRAIDLSQANMAMAPEGLREISWVGPLYLATRPPTVDEKFEAIARGLAGEDLGMRPVFWRAPSETATALAKAAKPLSKLNTYKPDAEQRLADAVASTGRPRTQLGYLPILARRTDWCALIDLQDGSVVGYVAIDGF